ncbi:hypothetical protein Ancab_028836 [Ancistrocladus abbreviatus]
MSSILMLVDGGTKENQTVVSFGLTNDDSYQLPSLSSRKQQQQHQFMNYSLLDKWIYFTSKRKVPNASDPLHNR